MGAWAQLSSWRLSFLITVSLSPTQSNWNTSSRTTLRGLLYDCLTQLVLVHFPHIFMNKSHILFYDMFVVRQQNLFWPCSHQHYVELLLDTFFYFIIWTLFSIMFSSESNSSETARVRWCCQLCVKLVTELSTQCCSHLRSWQPTVVSEQQTHFSITPLSPTHHPPATNSLLILFDILLLFNHLIHCLLSLLLPSSLFLACFPYFLTCTLVPFIVFFFLSAIHPHWTHCSSSPHILPCSLTHSHLLSLCLHVVSPPLTSQQLPLFSVSNLKLCLLQRWQRRICVKEQGCSCCRHISLFLRR